MESLSSWYGSRSSSTQFSLSSDCPARSANSCSASTSEGRLTKRLLCLSTSTLYSECPKLSWMSASMASLTLLSSKGALTTSRDFAGCSLISRVFLSSLSATLSHLRSAWVSERVRWGPVSRRWWCSWPCAPWRRGRWGFPGWASAGWRCRCSSPGTAAGTACRAGLGRRYRLG